MGNLLFGGLGMHGDVAEDDEEWFFIGVWDCYMGVEPVGKEAVTFRGVAAAAFTVDGAE